MPPRRVGGQPLHPIYALTSRDSTPNGALMAEGLSWRAASCSAIRHERPMAWSEAEAQRPVHVQGSSGSPSVPEGYMPYILWAIPSHIPLPLRWMPCEIRLDDCRLKNMSEANVAVNTMTAPASALWSLRATAWMLEMRTTHAG